MSARISLGSGASSILLPDLFWEDEQDYDARAQSVEQTLGGAAVIEEWERLSGRPVTLAGGLSWAWLRLSELNALRAFGASGAELVLTLLDNRTLTVRPRRDGPGGSWIEASPVPRVGDSPALDEIDPRYAIEKIRLIEV